MKRGRGSEGMKDGTGGGHGERRRAADGAVAGVSSLEGTSGGRWWWMEAESVSLVR